MLLTCDWKECRVREFNCTVEGPVLLRIQYDNKFSNLDYIQYSTAKALNRCAGHDKQPASVHVRFIPALM